MVGVFKRVPTYWKADVTWFSKRGVPGDDSLALVGNQGCSYLKVGKQVGNLSKLQGFRSLTIPGSKAH